MFEYTPGPWKVRQNSFGGHNIQVDKGKTYERLGEMRKKEDAQLTIAAPVMYEAIIHLKRWYENGSRTGKTLDDMLRPLFDAVIKVRGGK